MASSLRAPKPAMKATGSTTAIATLGGLAGVGAAVCGYLSRGGVREPSTQAPGWKAKVAGVTAPILAGLSILVVLVSLTTSVVLDLDHARAGWAKANPRRDEAARHKEQVRALERYVSELRDLKVGPAIESSEHEVPLQEEKRKLTWR